MTPARCFDLKTSVSLDTVTFSPAIFTFGILLLLYSLHSFTVCTANEQISDDCLCSGEAQFPSG